MSKSVFGTGVKGGGDEEKRGIKDDSQVSHVEDLVNKVSPFIEVGKSGAKSDLGVEVEGWGNNTFLKC